MKKDTKFAEDSREDLINRTMDDEYESELQKRTESSKIMQNKHKKNHGYKIGLLIFLAVLATALLIVVIITLGKNAHLIENEQETNMFKGMKLTLIDKGYPSIFFRKFFESI